MMFIISKDKDFAGVFAEQAQRELGLASQLFAHENEAQAALNQDCKVIVTTEYINIKFNIPLLAIAASEERNPMPGARIAPVRMQDVLAEIHEMLHNPAPGDKMTLAGGYDYLPLQKELTDAAGKRVALTDKEAQLLLSLHKAGSQGISREALLKDVWGIETDMDTHTLETHIYRLRTKLRELAGDDDRITAMEGGYRMDTE